MTYLTHTGSHTCRTAPRRVSLFDLVALYRQRHNLRRLDENALSDIGLTRDAADREARRPLWDVPAHWLK